MSCALLSDLAWLPRPPADFREQCRAVLAHAAVHHDGEQDGGEPDGRGAGLVEIRESGVSSG